MSEGKKPIHIPLKEDEAIKLFTKVRPTADMPRPGATGKKKATKKVAKNTKNFAIKT